MDFKNFISIISLAVIFAINPVSAQEETDFFDLSKEEQARESETTNPESDDTEDSFREQLINELKEQYDLSFFNNPMLSIYADSTIKSESESITCHDPSSCYDRGSSSSQQSLDQICEVVVNSEECKKVKPKEDLLDCSQPMESKSFDSLDFIIGCGKGLWNTVVEFFDFIWTIIKSIGDIPEKFMEYAESAKLYLVNEYDKAYEEAGSFKTLSAIKAVASKLGERVYEAVQNMARTEYREFGCLNFQARTKKVCTLLGTFVDPFIMLKALKLGKRTYHAMGFGGKSEKVSDRKFLNQLPKDDPPPPLFKGRREKMSEALRIAKKNGDIKRGVVEVTYIGKEGKVKSGWVKSKSGNYVYTEQGRAVPINQVTEITSRGNKGLEDHQRIRSLLGAKGEIEVRFKQINPEDGKMSEGYGTLSQLTDDGVHVQGRFHSWNLDKQSEMFIDARNISGLNHSKITRQPLPLSAADPIDVRIFRTAFNTKKYEELSLFHGNNYRNPERYVSLDYKGEKRMGIITDHDDSYGLKIDLIGTEGKGIERLSLSPSASDQKKILESIRVSDAARRRFSDKYAGSDIPMAPREEQGRFMKNKFREAFNSGSLTDDVKYIHFDRTGASTGGYISPSDFFQITKIDRKRGRIHVRSLSRARYNDNPPEEILFSHFLENAAVSREARRFALDNNAIRAISEAATGLTNKGFAFDLMPMYMHSGSSPDVLTAMVNKAEDVSSAMGLKGRRQQVNFLQRIIEHPNADPYVKTKVIDSLQHPLDIRRSEGGGDILQQLARDPSEEVRIEAARVIAGTIAKNSKLPKEERVLLDPDADRMLRRLERDPSEEVRRAVKEALNESD